MSYKFSWRQPLIPRHSWTPIAQILEGFVQWMTIICAFFAITITWKLTLVFVLQYLFFHAWFSVFMWFREVSNQYLESNKS